MVVEQPSTAVLAGPQAATLDVYHEPPDGCFGAIDAQILRPHLKYRLSSLLDFGAAGTDTVQLPAASLEWVVAPRIELGYRIPEGLGGFIISYRQLTTRSEATLLGFGASGNGALLTRLDMHVVDFDYTSKEWTVAEVLKVQWRIGVRFASIFADTAASDDSLFQRSSNYFDGVGPHVGLDLWEPLPCPGMGFFVRAEAATLAGRVHQTFEEVALTGGGLIGAGNNFSHTQGVPFVSLQAGLSWSSGIFAPESVTFTAGYVYEHWWYIGNLGGNIADNKAGLWSQGLFIRGEWRY
jgi:hypothetical protein